MAYCIFGRDTKLGTCFPVCYLQPVLILFSNYLFINTNERFIYVVVKKDKIHKNSELIIINVELCMQLKLYLHPHGY